MECPIYSVKFLVVYYTSLDSGREDAEYFTLTNLPPEKEKPSETLAGRFRELAVIRSDMM